MRHNSTVLLLILGAISASVLGSLSCAGGGYAGNLEPITIGMESTPVNSLIYIAADQGFFAANGLEVTTKDYPSGLSAVGGLLNGEVDIATAAEFVIVGKALANEGIGTFGSIDKFRHNYLVGRKDRGIRTIADLKGKRIGVPLKTAAEFYLGRFLELQGISMKKVTLVNVSPPQSVEALASGDVDAVIAWQPNVRSIEDRLGENVVKWPAQSEQAAYCNTIATSQWIIENPQLINRFLSALVRAEALVAADPDLARSIVQERLGYEAAYTAAVWPEHQFSLMLDQSLVLAMEDQARWMIGNNLTDAKKTPDFLKHIYADGAEAVTPGSVSIIR